jgi:carboxyl-terminal processing protease
MTNFWRPAARIGVAASLLLSASVMVVRPAPAQQAPAVADGAALFDLADQITRLVQNGKIDDLAKLPIPDAPRAVSRLHDWTSSYVTTIQKQEQQRDKQYAEAVGKAQDLLKQEKFDKAMDRIVSAYRIAKDPDSFLQQPWVRDLTAKVAAQAGDLEKKGQWLESLQLFSDLNTLYEVDTTYKADMQRLARRTRLLAVYTPRTLAEMRKAIVDREREADPASATQPAPKDEEPAAFTRWQDYVENINISQASDAIDRSAADWVEKTSYETLVKGGVEALRLFLTTPELAKEFPALGDAEARKAFNAALDGAMAATGAGRSLGSDEVQRIMTGLVQASNNSIKLPREVVIMEFTDGAMERLDPFTAVIWPHEVDEFEKNTRGSFGGVGIQISLESGQLKVISPLEDTPAYKAGIEAGDVITAIDGKSTVGISIDQAVHSIMGKPGSPVVLKIKRGTSADKEYSIRRDIIKVASIKGFRRDPQDTSRWDFMMDPDNKIGYIRITGFQEDTAEDLEKALRGLQAKGMRGVILDLRFNPGGLLNAAVDISDMFLQDGVIVSTRGRSLRARPQEWRAHSDTIIPPNMPMVVLVNEYSASASEIFSGAMKDLHRALIVGHRSFGKGSVQNLLKIGDDVRPDGNPEAMMKLTMAYYYLPNGESLHRRDNAKKWGVDPDVVVDLTPEQLADLLKSRRDSEIIRAPGTPTEAPATSPGAKKEEPVADTQLDTALLMMRLQLVQSKA